MYSFREGAEFGFRNVVTGIVLLCILFVLIWEDAINGYIACKRTLKGTQSVKSVFRDDGYFSETELGRSEWKYDKIIGLAESKRYFVFIFSQSHAQVYDKNSLTGGSVSGFCAFNEKKTGRKMMRV